MNLRTLTYAITMPGLLREILFSNTRMAEDTFAAPFAAKFDALRTEWKIVLMEEIEIIEGMTRADAHAAKIDSIIDAFAAKTSRAVDDNTTGATRKRLREALFKSKPLSKFTRPILGQQLTAMNDWGSILSNSNIAPLAALAQEHADLMTQAEQADTQRQSAQQKNREFRLIGHRKQFIDKVNAARQEVAGALGKIELEQPGVPQGYANGFFTHEASRDDEPTIDEVNATIVTLEAELTEQKALLEKLQAEAEATRQAEAARKAQAEEAEQLEAQAKALLEQAAELKKRAGQK